jgi:hypothetical protein
MCDNCVRREVEAAGGWPPITDQIRAAGTLVAELYEHHAVGGPLHIVTDDYNVEDTHLDFCADWLAKSTDEDYSSTVRRVSAEILAMLRPMTPAERAVAVSCFDLDHYPPDP